MTAARRFRRRLLVRIRRTSALPPSPHRDAQLRRESERFARSPGVKAAQLRSLKKLKLLPDAAIARRAEHLDLTTACDEPVLWWPEEKKNGGYRQICDLPVKARVGQLIARDLVLAQWSAPPHFYDCPGRGIHRYVEAVRAAVTNMGPHVLLADIIDCYPSTNIAAISRLNLIPDEIVRYSLNPANLTFHHADDQPRERSPWFPCLDRTAEWTDPRGLLQGGPASSALLVALLAGVGRLASQDCQVLGYADDFIIVAATPEAAGTAGGDLARYLTECHAGPLHPHTDLRDARDGFQHVGCIFLQSGSDVVDCEIPDGKLTALIERTHRRIRTAWSEHRLRRPLQFVKVALGPYPWAPSWQRRFVRSEVATTIRSLVSRPKQGTFNGQFPE